MAWLESVGVGVSVKAHVKEFLGNGSRLCGSLCRLEALRGWSRSKISNDARTTASQVSTHPLLDNVVRK